MKGLPILLLVIAFGIIANADEFTITRDVAFTISRVEPAPQFVAVRAHEAVSCPCPLGDCTCEKCQCNTGAATVSSARAATQLAAAAPTYTVGDAGSSPAASLAREGVAQRKSPTTYTAATGRWLRSCGPNGCTAVWQASQPAARTEPQRQAQGRQRGGWYLGKRLGF